MKVHLDGLVRKATVKYKLPQSGSDLNLSTSQYKYTERNVKKLALVVTAEERAEVENLNLDKAVFNENVEKNENACQQSETSSDDEETVVQPEVEEQTGANIDVDDEEEDLTYEEPTIHQSIG